MTRFALIVLLATLSCRADHDAQSVATSGPPSGFVTYDSAGQRWARLISNRWLVGHTPTVESPARLLLQEQATTRCCIHAEHESDTQLQLSGWLDSLGNQRRLWHATITADRGALWGRFYVATDQGCCDSADALYFFDLATGGPRFTMSRYGDPPQELLPSITEPSLDAPRYVAFHDAYTSEHPAEMNTDSTVVGVLQYGGQSGPVQRIVVRKAEGTRTDVRLEHVAFGVGAKESTGGWPTRFGAPSWPQPAPSTGFDIRLHLFAYDDPPVELRIPVVRDTVRIEKATLPKQFTLARSTWRQPANER